MAPIQFWADMTWRDFQRADMREVIAVLPVAAIEQHGPHLPVGVDSVINEGYIRARRGLIPDDLPVAVPAGAGRRRLRRARRLSRHADALGRDRDPRLDRDRRQRRPDRLPQARRHEFARRQRRRDRGRDACICACAGECWRSTPPGGGSAIPEGLFSPRERAHGVHGGDAETSLMLAFRPDTRADGRGRAISSSAAEAIERDLRCLRAKPPLGFAWVASDLHPAGAVGEADKATAEKGEAAIAHGVERFIALLRDVQAFDLARLRARPAGSGAVSGPHFDFEREAIGRGCRWVAGVDEVGRGPLAGPVGVAAVILDPDDLPEGLDDSKALPEARRDALRPIIFAKAISVSVAFASAEEIDRFNIRGATLRAMARAVAALHVRPDFVLIDGRDIPERARLSGARRSSAATRCRCRSPPPRSSPRRPATR